MIRLLYPVALLLASIPAHAAGDERLASRAYNTNEVVRINGRVGVQAAIGFGEQESIENVAIGDSEAWQITPNKRADLLFLKPLAVNARTNMTVVTDKHTYFFDLVASPKATPLYMLRFTYPKEAKPAAQPGAALGEAGQQAIDNDLASAPVDPAFLNFAWERKGNTGLQPSQIYDDGDSTYLLWGDRQKIPAILVLNEKGEEGPVNYAVRGNTIVIDEVPDKIVLRIAKKVATLQNQRGLEATATSASAIAAAPAQAQPASVAATDLSPTFSQPR